MKRPAIILSVVTVAALGVGAVVMMRGDGRPGEGSSLRILFSGETLGELEPCDCSGKMAGGLPIRGGYIAKQSGDYLLVDVGNVGRGARQWEILRAQATVRAMKQMRYDACNLGEHELWLGEADLKKITDLGVSFVSANVLDDKGEPAVSPFMTLRRNGLTIAITGVVDHEAAQPGEGLRVEPPAEALGRLIPELKKRAGVIIVLADLEEPAVNELAKLYPEISAILFRGRGDSRPPHTVNRTVTASIYGEALYLGDMTLTWDANRRINATGEAILMDEAQHAASSDVVAASIDWYKQAIDGRTFDLAEARSGWEKIQPSHAPPGNGFVGSQACASCHQQAHSQWSNNPHAHAMETLERVGYAYSPECIVCHVVGYGVSDGYASRQATPQLAAVGCEQCHGPGQILLDGNCRGVARMDGQATCMQCHTLKHHAEFNFAKHMPLIEHEETP